LFSQTFQRRVQCHTDCGEMAQGSDERKQCERLYCDGFNADKFRFDKEELLADADEQQNEVLQ